MTRKKIVLIGAGSTTFTQRLVADLILSGAPELWELALVDIDEEVLESIHLVTQKMLEAKGVSFPVTATTDRRAVLKGADFVVTTIAVGGRRGWEMDVKVPRKYGVYQPVGDTMMPGGISRALRMIPPMIDIANDVKELCPKAYFFNYSNPMTAVCTAVRRTTEVPLIGLCHGMHVALDYFERFLGVEKGSMSSLGVGLNHLTFLSHVFYKGQDAFPLFREKLNEQQSILEQEITEKTEFINWISDRAPRYSDDPFSWSFFETHGLFPIMLDRHVSEFFPEKFPMGKYYGKTLGIDAFPIDERIAWGDEIYKKFTRIAHSQDSLPKDFFEQVPGEHEQLLDIMTSLLTDKRTCFSVNMPNEGAVPNLPADAVLELPAVATAKGFCQLQMPPLPEHLANIIRNKLKTIDLTIEAALKGNEELFVEALLADGSVGEKATAQLLAKDLLETHKEHLPQFSH
ncbi:MAG: hypothetical protein KC422_17190 [Trueperaceae bacterium]|nr:hypothetical protein [Trueperaceae bacterium]